jgi:hypothetical protein
MIPYVTRLDLPATASSSGSDVQYDWSGADQLLKRRDALGELKAAKYKALYEGDNPGGVTAERRIRDLLASMENIQPVRVSRSSVEAKSQLDRGAVHGTHNPPKQDEEKKEEEKKDGAPPNNAAAVNTLRPRVKRDGIGGPFQSGGIMQS